LSYSGVRPL